MALIPPQYLDTVTAIGIVATQNGKSNTNWVGTGFLVGDLIVSKGNKPEDKSYKIYLVTNKHVIGKNRNIVLRFNPQSEQPSKDFPAPLYDKTGKKLWYGHPNPAIDVAVIPINVRILQEQGMKFSFFASEQNLFTSQQLQEEGVLEGDFIYVMGFPMGLVGADSQYVLVRSGIISRIRDLYGKRNTNYVVDAMVFPGNSGGPVLIKPELTSITGTKSNKSCKLIGIVKSYIPYREVAISQQTKRPRMIFEENSGLSIVEPTEHIMATIQLAKEKEKKKKV